MFLKRIHVFKAGDQTSAQGVARTFSPKDLEQVVKSYDPSVHEAPLVLGHQGDNDSMPSYGWIKGFERQGDNLYADVAFTDVAKDLVKDGHYRKVSISFYSPDSQINPHPGQWTARHLALLGASPPAVKGLEPFNFAEWDARVGIYDFAADLDPSKVFDEDLGPTLVREQSPLEMLKEKLDLARSEMQAEVEKAVGAPEQDQETVDASADAQEAENSASELDETGSPANFAERPRRGDNARSVAALEDKFPKDEYMEGISRKKKSTPHGSVSQVVENVYAEDEEMSADHEEMGADNPKMRNPRMQPGKTDFKEGFVPATYNSHGPHDMVGADRYDSSKSGEQQADRYKVGKTTPEKATFGRYDTAKSSEQNNDRNKTAKSGEQEKDRTQQAESGEQDKDRYSEDMDQIFNNDQYDDNVDYGVNDAKTASGSNPAGREDSDTKVPTEVEEMPSDEVFAVGVENSVKSNKTRVMQVKAGQKLNYSHGNGAPGLVTSDHAEPEPAETVGKAGAYAESKNKQLSGEFEGGPNETTLKSGGAYAERSEPKSNKKALTPGAFDSEDDDEPAEVTGPGGVTGGADHGEMPEAFKKNAMKMKAKAKGKMADDDGDEDDMAAEHSEEERHGQPKGNSQLSGQYDGGVAEITSQSGAYAEHDKSDNPYTRTGYGSTYKEGDEVDEEFCDMGKPAGRKAKAMPEFSEFMEQLQALKAENERLRHEYREAKIRHRKAELHSFVEGLYEEGKMLDSVMPQGELMSFAEGLEFGTLEFAEGETAADRLLGLLSRLPNMVDFHEYAGGAMQYVEEADLDPHQRALKMVEESEGKLDYVEALKKAMYS